MLIDTFLILSISQWYFSHRILAVGILQLLLNVTHYLFPFIFSLSSLFLFPFFYMMMLVLNMLVNVLITFFSIGRHSKSLDVVTKRCGLCYGVFELLVNTRRKSGTIAQQAVKSRSPIGFARFVKENYGSVKQSRTDLKHADIMRQLGQQFSAMKMVPGARKQ
jgi:magnesium-transporting ATPase (P-type)